MLKHEFIGFKTVSRKEYQGRSRRGLINEPDCLSEQPWKVGVVLSVTQFCKVYVGIKAPPRYGACIHQVAWTDDSSTRHAFVQIEACCFTKDLALLKCLINQESPRHSKVSEVKLVGDANSVPAIAVLNPA